jgi:hypothetical protein
MDALPPFSSVAESIVQEGIYRHYSGKEYKVLAIARHSETLEELVVYQTLYGEQNVWVRPLSMFVEMVLLDGKELSRFSLVEQK